MDTQEKNMAGSVWGTNMSTVALPSALTEPITPLHMLTIMSNCILNIHNCRFVGLPPLLKDISSYG